MVIWSRTARNDLMDILYALITWKQEIRCSIASKKKSVKFNRNFADFFIGETAESGFKSLKV